MRIAGGIRVQDEARRRDDAVAAFLLHAGQTGEKLVGHVLAQPGLAKALARDRQRLARASARRAAVRCGSATRARTSPRRRRGSCPGCGRGARPPATRASGVTMRHDARLSSAVPHSTAFLPPAFMATLPPMHEASADVGSTAKTSPRASATSITRLVTTPAPQSIVGVGFARPGRTTLSTADRRSSFSVLMTAERGVERHRAAGIAGAAAARNDRQPEFDAAADEAAHLVLGVRMEHDERILDAPVGRVGHVRDAREAIERDVVLACVARQQRAACACAAPPCRETRPRTIDGGARAPRAARRLSRRGPRRRSSARRLSISRSRWRSAPISSAAALRIVQQVVLQIGIALDDPDVAQDFEQHPRRASGATLAAQLDAAASTSARPAGG